ncbi:kinase-like domain-containing protein, partial [Powellomyces hirtus]
MSSVHPSTAPTTAIGDYLVSHEIGRGSFATVYMGKAISTGRPVAVKSVSRDKLNRKLAENLESEIKILKGIQHDHVVALLDIVSTEKHIHLIMEYCSLGDLSHYIKRRGLVGGATVEGGQWNPLSGPWGGLNEIVVRHFLRQLASAMEFLRAHNLIHRDLKPQNVLLCPAPADATNIQIPSPSQPGLLASVPALPVLKLADFGFARALPSHSLASTLCGSPLYMAPEILRGDKYGPSADLWSFGAILYEMICGRPPFKAQNYIDLLRKIERGEGIIRFPGEDMASLTARRSSALSSSPSSRLGTSPGSNSPRFPPNMKGVPPIGEDLKDLIRRLLKRNPAERMPFEAFF